MSAHPPSGSESRPENRLGRESSPYLLLHRHNPVDWYPWGEEALGRARAEDRPIFLSVGYSTCYWCHVMERESFSDPRTAALMNREFVNIKVDREERPDLDEIYMTATQLLTGQGGWPNSVFLTPALAPFYAGTYFPPEDRYGRPGFRTLLTGLADSWRRRRDEVELQADELLRAMRRYLEERVQPGDSPPSPAVAGAALAALEQRFDAQWGGFGGAPKFPGAADLFLLLELAGAEQPEAGGRAAAMLHATLDHMARGGLYDQLAGGFHRYSTDREWKVPHFEKMLYDNGLLLELYARESERTGDPEMARVAGETAAFLAREMTVEGGAFASAIDAETDGHEGAYYVWTRPELRQVLGEEDHEFLAPLYGFAGEPFFEGQAYVLHLPERLDAQAEHRRTGRDELLTSIAPLRQRLLAARSERQRPLTDDKVLADWNGLAIAGMAEAGRVLGTPEWVERAARAADFVLSHLRPKDRLMHSWRGGRARVAAMAADYAFLVHGLLALHRATLARDGGEEHWLTAAAELAGEQIERLGDGSGGFYAAPDLPDLLLRPKDALDGAVPSASGVAASNFLALAERTGDEQWRREAERTLSALAPLVERFPEGNRTAVVATLRWAVVTGGPHRAGDEGSRPSAAASPLQAEAEGTGRVEADLSPADADGWRRFRVELALGEGWHANASTVADPALVATALEGENAELRGVRWPDGEPLAEGGPAVYRGAVAITGEARAVGDGAAALVLTWQPCDDTRCLPPVRRTVPLR
ncbi:MAG TPA: DUF255 domain-containing protein [Thermoanaerobaculia bacterium]|nr:DUF255 domain-containing protein [Thermoanaerobaculia bacterium]